jgi:outer membrane protein assembly factor BamE (lipoprotein component of BamABCDE complex)
MAKGDAAMSNSLRFVFGVSLFCALCVCGCITQPPPPPPLPAQTEQPQDAKSGTTYGTITTKVVKGKTTQTELLEYFGGPNISTTDADGTETWVYESKSSSSTTQNQGAASARVDAMSLFFGIGGLSQGTGQGQYQNSGTTTTSSKNLTFIVKFNPDKTVKDYSVRQSSF